MTTSYTNPTASDKDAVRFLIGDTDTTSWQLTDEEIGYLLAEGGGVKRAASKACRAIAAKYARKVDRAMGDLRISYSQLQSSYLALATQLEADSSSGAVPFLGGQTIARKEDNQQNTDLVQPSFTKTQFDSEVDEPSEINPSV